MRSHRNICVHIATADGGNVKSLIAVLRHWVPGADFCADNPQEAVGAARRSDADVPQDGKSFVNLVLVASPFVGTAPLQAALQVGCHYLDINCNFGKAKILDPLKPVVEESGIIALATSH